MNAFNYTEPCRCGLPHRYWVTRGPGLATLEPCLSILAHTWPTCYNCEAPLDRKALLERALASRHDMAVSE